MNTTIIYGFKLIYRFVRQKKMFLFSESNQKIVTQAQINPTKDYIFIRATALPLCASLTKAKGIVFDFRVRTSFRPDRVSFATLRLGSPESDSTNAGNSIMQNDSILCWHSWKKINKFLQMFDFEILYFFTVPSMHTIRLPPKPNLDAIIRTQPPRRLPWPLPDTNIMNSLAGAFSTTSRSIRSSGLLWPSSDSYLFRSHLVVAHFSSGKSSC